MGRDRSAVTCRALPQCHTLKASPHSGHASPQPSSAGTARRLPVARAARPLVAGLAAADAVVATRAALATGPAAMAFPPPLLAGVAIVKAPYPLGLLRLCLPPGLTTGPLLLQRSRRSRAGPGAQAQAAPSCPRRGNRGAQATGGDAAVGQAPGCPGHQADNLKRLVVGGAPEHSDRDSARYFEEDNASDVSPGVCALACDGQARAALWGVNGRARPY